MENGKSALKKKVKRQGKVIELHYWCCLSMWLRNIWKNLLEIGSIVIFNHGKEKKSVFPCQTKELWWHFVIESNERDGETAWKRTKRIAFRSIGRSKFLVINSRETKITSSFSKQSFIFSQNKSTQFSLTSIPMRKDGLYCLIGHAIDFDRSKHLTRGSCQRERHCENIDALVEEKNRDVVLRWKKSSETYSTR